MVEEEAKTKEEKLAEKISEVLNQYVNQSTENEILIGETIVQLMSKNPKILEWVWEDIVGNHPEWLEIWAKSNEYYRRD